MRSDSSCFRRCAFWTAASIASTSEPMSAVGFVIGRTIRNWLTIDYSSWPTIPEDPPDKYKGMSAMEILAAIGAEDASEMDKLDAMLDKEDE